VLYFVPLPSNVGFGAAAAVTAVFVRDMQAGGDMQAGWDLVAVGDMVATI